MNPIVLPLPPNPYPLKWIATEVGHNRHQDVYFLNLSNPKNNQFYLTFSLFNILFSNFSHATFTMLKGAYMIFICYEEHLR